MRTKKQNFIKMLKMDAIALQNSDSKQRRSDGRILNDFADLIGDYLPNIVEYSETPNAHIKLDVLNRYLKDLNVYTFALNRPSTPPTLKYDYTNLVIVKRTFKANVKIETKAIYGKTINLELIKECLENGTATITREL